MDSPSSAADPKGPTGPQLMYRDRVIAAALRRLNRGLECSTCTAYLLTEDDRALAAAMMVDTTLSFTVPSGMAADDRNFSTARAHQAGKLVLFENTELQELTRRSPALFIHNPYPMMVASAPVRTLRYRFGALSVRWVPPRPVATDSLDFLQAVADDLAVELTDLADQGAWMKAPYVPLFIAEVSRARAAATGAAAEATAGWRCRSSRSRPAARFSTSCRGSPPNSRPRCTSGTSSPPRTPRWSGPSAAGR